MNQVDSPQVYFPASLSSITPSVLQAVLQEKYPGVQVEALKVIKHAKCGDGIASTADRVHLRLQYTENSQEDLPRNVVLKTILLHRFLRFGLPVILTVARILNFLDKIPILGIIARPLTFYLINIYQRFFPHAPEAMYENEVRFYRTIRNELPAELEMPKVYASVINSRNGQFGIVMEDLSLRGANFPSAISSASLVQMQSLLRGLAKLHATYWETPRLKSDLSWLPKTFEGGMFPVFKAIGLDMIRNQVESNMFKKELLKPLGKTVDELWELNWKSQVILYKAPLTILHGDPHFGNTYVLPNGEAGFLDFQLTVQGPWVNDVCYLLVTSLSTEERREHQEMLLRYYLDQLLQLGVAKPPSFKDAWLMYRLAAIWGCVIGWLITPPQNYGITITTANIKRTVEAIIDLETINAIESAGAVILPFST